MQPTTARAPRLGSPLPPLGGSLLARSTRSLVSCSDVCVLIPPAHAIPRRTLASTMLHQHARDFLIVLLRDVQRVLASPVGYVDADLRELEQIGSAVDVASADSDMERVSALSIPLLNLLLLPLAWLKAARWMTHPFDVAFNLASCVPCTALLRPRTVCLLRLRPGELPSG